MAATGRISPTGVQSRGACGSVWLYASHSDLWASHHAGKAGSFGERVGRTCFKKRAVSFFMLKVSITPATVPKRINFIPVSLPRGRNSPEYRKSGSIAVNAGASVLTQFNWPYRYSMLRRFACMAFLSNNWTMSPINSLPLTILAWMILSFGVSCVTKHRLKMAWTLPLFSSCGLN